MTNKQNFVKRGRWVALTAAVALTVAACGGDDEDAAASSAAASASASDVQSENEAAEKDAAGDDGKMSEEEQQAFDRGAPGVPDEGGGQSTVLERVEGNAKGGCVDVSELRDARSGGFMAGPFDEARSGWGTAREGFKRDELRLYFVPQRTEPMPGVTVTATNGDEVVEVTQDNVADAEQWKFYDVRLRLPDDGTWTVKATAGRDKGCFTLSL